MIYLSTIRIKLPCGEVANFNHLVQSWFSFGSVLVQILIDYQLVTEVFGTKLVQFWFSFGKKLVRFQSRISKKNKSKIKKEQHRSRKRTTPFLTDI